MICRYCRARLGHPHHPSCPALNNDRVGADNPFGTDEVKEKEEKDKSQAIIIVIGGLIVGAIAIVLALGKQT